MSELDDWKTGKNVLVTTLVGALLTGGLTVLGKKVKEKTDEKDREDVIMETKSYKVTKKSNIANKKRFRGI